MKNVVENKVCDTFKKYRYSTLLTLVIFILFLISGYSDTVKKYTVYVGDDLTDFEHGIYTTNNEQYIHIDDLTSIFSDNVFNDKISGKLIITTNDSLKDIKKDDESYTVKKDNEIYFAFEKVMTELNKDIVIIRDKIYVLDYEYIDAVVTNNRTEIYDVIDNNVIAFAQKDSKVKLLISGDINNSKTVNVIFSDGTKEYYGYTLKENIRFEYDTQEEQAVSKKQILVKAENKLMSSTDTKYIDMVAINMYRLSGVNTLAKLEYENNVPSELKVFATINNGQKSANYDSDIITGMLNSYNNRQSVINKIIDISENLSGINIDFGNLKVSDKNNFTQFIKELAAMLHSCNKQLIVNIPSNKYIDVKEVAKFADYVVIQPYGNRTLASKTSGPISSVKYVEENIKQIANEQVSVDKVILEIPAYSILWTERRGTVINAEQYSMKAAQLYVQSNGMEYNLDSNSNQNYINYTKGITTYKMWLEDLHSVTEKTKLVNKYGLAGISIYRSGMELEEIYKSISQNLNK